MSFAQDIPAPGGAPAPQTGHPGTAAPQGGGAPPGGALGAMFPLLIVIPMVLLMVFMNRSQQKKQKEFESKLKVGDRVVTQAGLVGKLVTFERESRLAKLEVAPGVKIDILRTSVVSLDGDGVTSAAPASSK